MSSPKSETEVFVLRDLDLGVPVSTSTIFGLSSMLLIVVSNGADSLLLWIGAVCCSLLVSSNLSCKIRVNNYEI